MTKHYSEEKRYIFRSYEVFWRAANFWPMLDIATFEHGITYNVVYLLWHGTSVLRFHAKNRPNSQFRHVIHSEISDQSDRCWNHHLNDAISSHTLTLFAYVIRSEFTKFESFWCTKIFVEITFGRIALIWDDAQVSERWAIDERRKGGGGITPRLPFLYLMLLIPSITRK